MIPECKLFISRKTYKSADRYKNVRIGPTIKKRYEWKLRCRPKTLKAVGVTDGPLVLMCVQVYHRATPEVGEYMTKNKESKADGLHFSKTKPVATQNQCQVKVDVGQVN
jgi:hypothetical protein